MDSVFSVFIIKVVSVISDASGLDAEKEVVADASGASWEFLMSNNELLSAEEMYSVAASHHPPFGVGRKPPCVFQFPGQVD